MSKDLISQLKKMKNYNGRINPDHSWVASTRQTMMKQISNTVSETRPTFSFDMIWQGMSILVPTKFVYAVVRPLLVFLVVGAVATSGWIASVSATEDCLPGDMCYGVKMAVEKTQEIVLAVTGSDEEETQLHLEFASRRAKEIKHVVEKKDDIEAPQKAQVAIAKLEKSLQSANESVKKASEKTPEKVVEVSKKVKEKTDEIKQSLKEAEETSEDVDVSEAKKLAKDTSLTAVEAVVQKKAEGKVVISEEEVKIMVEEEISGVLGDSDENKKNVDKVAQEVVTDEAGEETVVVTSTLSVVTSTEEIVSVTTVVVSTTVKEMVDEVVKTVGEAGEVVKGDLAEAQDLVDNNQLLEAIQKVKEANDVSNEAEKVVGEVKKVVKEARDEQEALEEESIVVEVSVPETELTETVEEVVSSTEEVVVE